MKVIVWQLVRDLAVARGLGSNEQHNDPLFGATFGNPHCVKQLWDARCYEPVASIDSPEDGEVAAMDHAFVRTNSVHGAWYEVTRPLSRGRGYRSTSVGDVLEIVKLEASEFYIVSNVGFNFMPTGG
jgi:hypothetical protein